MSNVIGLISKYYTPAIDAVYVAESKSMILDTPNKFIRPDPNNAKGVYIMDMLVDGLSDYYRVNEADGDDDYVHKQSSGKGDGYDKANVTAHWEYYELSIDRGTQFQIDASSNEETDGMLIANTAVEFYKTKYVPEKDAYIFSKLASLTKVSYGNYVEEDIPADSIFAKIDAGVEWLANHEVPEDEQVIFTTPYGERLMKQSKEIYRTIKQEDYRNSNGITFKVKMYDNKPIIVVPPSRFFTNIRLGRKGYYTTDNSKLINFMIVSKKAVLIIQKILNLRIFNPAVVQDFDGYKVNARFYYDVIVPKNKIPGIYCSVSTTSASTKVDRVDVALKKGSVSNAFQVESFLTTPAGINGRLIYNTTSKYTIGDTKTPGSTDKLVTLNTDIVEASATTAYFALINSRNEVCAISDQVTLTKKS